MSKQAAFSTLLMAVLALLPAKSQARYLNTDTGRFQTMDTYEGDNEDPLSLHKYLYAQDNPVGHVDPSGLAIWLCTRTTTDDFPCYCYGRHAYLWDDRANATPPRDCGQEGNFCYGSWCGTTEDRDKGPIANSLSQITNTLPADVQALIVVGSQGHEEEIMTYARQHINDQVLWWPGTDGSGAGGNDCHTAAVTVLEHFPYLKIPPSLRWNPGDKEKIRQIIASHTDVISAAVDFGFID